MERKITDEDLWSTDTGIFTDYEGVVIDAWFNIDPNIQQTPPPTFLFLKMQTNSEEHPEWTERYNCGPDWQSIDGGETVVHPTKPKFSRNSQAGILVDTAAKLVGEDIRSWGAPTTAKTWEGSRWHMAAVERKGKRRDTGEEWRSTRNFPSHFLGKGEGEARVGDDREQVVSGGVDGPAPALEIDPPIMSMMRKLAGEGLTQQEWMDKVLEVPGVLDNDLLIRTLPKPSFYESMKEHK